MAQCGGKGRLHAHHGHEQRNSSAPTGLLAAAYPSPQVRPIRQKSWVRNQVVISFFGDSASNEGTFHESLNMASAWKLPVVYIIENNLYGISVGIDRVTNVKNLSDRAQGIWHERRYY